MSFRSKFLKIADDGEDEFQTLDQILNDYDKPGFISWVYDNRKDYDIYKALEKIDPGDRVMYTRMIKECASSLLPMISDLDVPYPLCPSHLQDQEILLPNEFILQWPVEQLVDEYFGICYQPERIRSRFSPGFKEAVLAKIKQEMPHPGDLLETEHPGIQAGLSVLEGPELLDIYDSKTSQDWWSGLGPEGQREWIKSQIIADHSLGEWLGQQFPE